MEWFGSTYLFHHKLCSLRVLLCDLLLLNGGSELFTEPKGALVFHDDKKRPVRSRHMGLRQRHQRRHRQLARIQLTMLTSSNKMLNSLALCIKSALILALTTSLCVINSAASNCATVAFNTSLPILGNTLSS